MGVQDFVRTPPLIINAVASSGSIAVWAIWDQFPFIWASIIAISQVIFAVKPFLPYSQRLKLLVPYLDEIKNLYNKIEYNWYAIQAGHLSEKEINELLYKFKEKATLAETKFLRNGSLKENLDFQKQADKKTEEYFMNNF